MKIGMGSIGAVVAGLALAQCGRAMEPADRGVGLDHLVAIQQSLAADSLEQVAQHASALAKLLEESPTEGLGKGVGAQAGAVAKAKELKAAREAFKPLNASYEAYLKRHPDQFESYRVAFCPMAKASWVQTGDVIANPYYGKAMLKCGMFKK